MGAWYFGGLVLAALLALYQLHLLRDRESERCFRAFLNNAALGACVFIGIVLDYVFRV